MLYLFDGRQPSIGKDTYVSETAMVIGDVYIGDNCYIGHWAILRGDYGRIEIGSGTAVEEGVVMHAPPGKTCKVGLKVTIGHGAIIHSQEIGDMAVIGMGAITSIRAKIGTWAIVAEGAVVKMNQEIPEKVVAAGNPAKVVREVQERDEKFWTDGKQLYIDLAAKYLKVGMPYNGKETSPCLEEVSF
ncbi:MAG: gamma carbonic anhydrase family protein [Thermincola sp.]|nr:gamma carbonic anhydrase family protein [Thermincola sp.]MDT3702023.1 gamma carbonic anhydrase family protein [Thermincola sp.]